MNNNQQNLRAQYFATSEEYSREYQKYLDLKYSKRVGDEAKAAEVYTSLQKTDGKLKTLLQQVKSQQSDAGNQLLDTNTAIERKTFQIYEKSKTLDLQNDQIARKRQELINRQKQIEMGAQKNRYRRNVIIFLTIVNIVMLALIYKFYSSVA
jgi:uncharacterized protein (DUF3084 family)